MTRKKLPIGIQNFREIREDNCYYVDKTAFALRMVKEGKAYFLSRPRRFGKSLFLDTLAELLAGNEPLFRGLYCHDKWDWNTKYPVIRISFAEGVMASRAELDARIHRILAENESRFGVSQGEGGIPDRFIALIQSAEAKFGQRAVVLVDEYDKPILDNLTSPDLALEMRDGLRNLYSVIKGQDAHIKFAMLTGVSKFSKVNIFSGLNNLKDITLNAAYSAICGYTDADVDTVFAPELEGLDRDEIRHWYNGYNWRGEAVYNPFDLLLLFDEREFKSFWFETGTPTFLVDMLTERQVYLPALLKTETSSALISAFEVGDISTEALMFQSGYLTIAREKNQGGNIMFTLGYPNREVRGALTGNILGHWVSNPQKAVQSSSALYDALEANDFARIREIFFSLYASIPHDWYRKNNIDRFEGYYASVFYASFAAFGLDIVPEDVSNQGKLDMAIKFNEQIYLFEFKVVEDAAEGKALSQIKEKKYADKYRALNQPIHLIGVEFSKKERNVVGWAVESCGTGWDV
ncbi:ATPase AAA [Betaproteobacteria bacterium]|nr:ATPase AAA [Betaproteobacteria bacterium]